MYVHLDFEEVTNSLVAHIHGIMNRTNILNTFNHTKNIIQTL